jgi:hypothetical protein
MVASTRTSEPKLLAVYLNDHFAGASAGVELARRLARAHRGSPDGPVLQRVADEIAEDRGTLLEIMASLDVRPRRYKASLAWFGEKVGRLKPNGRLIRRSPLSSLLELEAMRLGVEGKAAGWRALRTVARHDERLDVERLAALEARARNQADILEELRVRTADDVFDGAR